MASSEKIEHALHLMSSADSMRTDNFICDFKIKVGSKTFNSHRLILAAHSQYFRALFSSDMKEVQQGYTVMDTVDPIVMQKCVEYMYTSKCDLQTDCASTMRLANYLQIPKLEESCHKHFLKTMSPNNCLSVLNMARTYHNQSVQTAAEHVVHNNLAVVMSTNLFQYINRQDLLSFIKSSHASDETTWKASTTWFNTNPKEIHLVLEQYDFSRFKVPFLLNTVLREPAIANSTKLTARVFQAVFSDSSKLEKSLNCENCFLLKNYASDINSKRIITSFMLNHVTSIITNAQIYTLTNRELVYFIGCPEVKAEAKWGAILKWVNHCPDQRKSEFPNLFRSINLHQLSVSFIEEHICPEKLVKNDHGCMKLLVEALIEHAKPSTELEEKGKAMTAFKMQPAKSQIYSGQTWLGDFLMMHVVFPPGSYEGVVYPRFSRSFRAPSKDIQKRLIQAFDARQLFKLYYDPDSACGRIQVGDIPLESGDLDEEYLHKLSAALSQKGF